MQCDVGPSGRLPGGVGGGKGPYNCLPVGVDSGSMLPGMCDHVSGSSFPLLARLLRIQRAHSERLERTHTNRPKINRHTTEGDGAEVDGK